MRHAFAVPLWWTALHATVKHFDFLLNCTGNLRFMVKLCEITVFESTTNYPNYHILSWRWGKLENLVKCWEQKRQFEPNSKLLFGPDPLKFRQRWLRYWAPGVVGAHRLSQVLKHLKMFLVFKSITTKTSILESEIWKKNNFQPKNIGWLAEQLWCHYPLNIRENSSHQPPVTLERISHFVVSIQLAIHCPSVDETWAPWHPIQQFGRVRLLSLLFSGASWLYTSMYIHTSHI